MQEFDSPAALIGIALSVLLFVSGTLVLPFLLRGSHQNRVQPWSLSWIEFGIFGWLLLILPTLFAVIADSFSLNRETNPAVASILAQSSLLCAFLLTWHLFGRGEKEVPTKKRGAVANGFLFFLAAYPIALAAGLLSQLLSYLGSLAGLPTEATVQPQIEILAETQSTWQIVVFVIAAVLVAPIVEELVFRAGVYRFLRSRYRPQIAAGVSSLLFALLHFHLTSVLPLFALGMMLCLAYERRGSLLTPIIVHALFNLQTVIQVFLIYPEIAS